MIGGHGDDAWKYAVPIRADFSSNVLYGGLDAGLREHLRSAIGGVTHYPEAGAESLQVAAAAAYGVEVESVLVTNGATEAIYLIAQAFRELAATVVGPTFAEYEDACRIQGMVVRWVDGRRLHEEYLEDGPLRFDEGIVFICHPNNPTGSVLPLSELLAMVDRWPQALFVVDESYIGFTRAMESVVAACRPNVLVLKSLTKSCRIPGLRVGFLVGPPALVGRVGACKMPWSVNRLAMEAGLYVFAHPADFVLPVESLLAATAEWRRELAAATGWRIYETDTPYFLFEGQAGLKEWLVQRHGLLVRDAANFRGLGPGYFRVACQSAAKNNLLTEALRECSRNGI